MTVTFQQILEVAQSLVTPMSTLKVKGHRVHDSLRLILISRWAHFNGEEDNVACQGSPEVQNPNLTQTADLVP